ncbi:tRNA pseudouridine synthase, putative [Talaromyces stipitatus ATCC 10500]|uniref:tRNA pseudouridine synthase 1 n=1 Tax=Talaromyces stipitatus (strain ATCC 10500 / CBS 375.48 / QM 6759 / NRRL 1006) TaxID=441959 RepID=B8M1I1_TALSN|nr:tRNA pseudouridine synthase, putative [Talaromyces stipitatus ATCC 10500]EED21877.1 tRNA pseudouridine synthase, putative [Talaromyces stipitatus ATCC 10500]
MAGRGGRNQKRHMGRNEYFRQTSKKNDENYNKGRDDEAQALKKRKIENGEVPMPIYATQFSAEDIAAEERRPKKKVAVMIGYSGTGYHGMQLSPTEKTIEGDLFAAFVAAGAISKANAADPKKSSLVRCARTDRGVHAAGNVVSLKLIVEDPDIVKKINDNLSPQIRVWGYEIVTKGFSCYQLCDSRMYEYLIPTHCFLPPHPSTHLGKKIVQFAEENEDMEGFLQRQEGVLDFWQNIDESQIKPILEKVPEEIRRLVQRALYIEDDSDKATVVDKEPHQPVDVIPKLEEAQQSAPPKASVQQSSTERQENSTTESQTQQPPKPKLTVEQKEIINSSIKQIKAAYQNAKRAYRIPQSRLQRVQDALDKYVGTRNFHNYTIQKNFRDPSSKRVIKSFVANKEPIIINGTEWVSLKVHGQSFMMHQIRKMVAMVALIVRCGCDPKIIEESYGPTRLSIPKAPGLGLLLEHPIFDSYNNRAAKDFNKETIDFAKYEKEMNEFKQREIYDRIFREEEESNAFGIFFNHVDHYPANTFLYLTSGGIAASREGDVSATAEKVKTGEEALAGIESEPEENASGAEGG